MTLWLLARRSLRQHLLSTVVTSLSLALAGGLWMAVGALEEQAAEAFERTDSGFDAVLGPRSSELQLVLNSLFHLDSSPGTISREDFEDIRGNPLVRHAIPIAVGDNYRGFRLVGTTPELFADIEYRSGQAYRVAPGGRIFDPQRKEAVAGSFAARRLGLSLGDEFHPYHGLSQDEGSRHQDVYVVVGILEPTNTPSDRALWIPLAGMQRMEGHDQALATDVSAVLLDLKSPQAGLQLRTLYNRQGDRLTLAWPIGAIVARLFDRFGHFALALERISQLVALVAVGSILASVYNSMNARLRDLAILRALGARRRTLLSAIVLETTSLAALGMALAFLFYLALFWVVAAALRSEVGVVLSPFELHGVHLQAPLSAIAASAVAGLLPALKAYRAEVARHLAPQA